eukprot:2662558-Pyramimonas_sp.AAC.1
MKLSPSQQQYWDVKRKYRDVVIFFKVGKFYELYEEDAQVGHDELGWKMTVSGVGHCRQLYYFPRRLTKTKPAWIQSSVAKTHKDSKLVFTTPTPTVAVLYIEVYTDQASARNCPPQGVTSSGVGPYKVH